MPLYKSLDLNSQTIVKIWKISEPKEFFMNQIELKPESLERVNEMKSELHQRGFLSVRMLLSEFGYKDIDLVYDSFGKPHLKDGKHISITHSYNFSAVVVSSKKVGVDIEKQREKITKIATKFIGFEDSYLNENDSKLIQKLTQIWCIKESLYKLYATPGMVFKKHFLVVPFGTESNSTIAWIIHNNNRLKFKAIFVEFEGFGCAIVGPNF
ncbi:MAG: 4'-phosphopantetheinyl transferase superfamily protein [Flavobacteriaceae bacterium]|jgi:4'-phosphopantetheinyl transferase|nr:4'-phosphopantetheinyl transferase superfamily protein [Flavobacteriaceae bacterium]